MSNRKVHTPDTCYIVSVGKNGYGDADVTTATPVKCAFFEQFRGQNAPNVELVQSDAYAYIDVSNSFVKSKGYQLQGLYFKIAPFGVDQWYLITTVQVAQRKLLTNDVNNVLINLQVVAKPVGGN